MAQITFNPMNPDEVAFIKAVLGMQVGNVSVTPMSQQQAPAAPAFVPQQPQQMPQQQMPQQQVQQGVPTDLDMQQLVEQIVQAGKSTVPAILGMLGQCGATKISLLAPEQKVAFYNHLRTILG